METNEKLLQLVRQYESDVKCRIVCLEDAFVDNYDSEDFLAQMRHWKTTLKQIKAVLREIK